MTEIRHLSPQLSIGLDNQSWVSPAVWLIDLNTGESLWEILDLFNGEYVDWKLSKIPDTHEGNEYGFLIKPQDGDDNNSIQYNFTYLNDAARTMLIAEGANRDFRVSIKSPVGFQEKEGPRAASA